MASYPGIASNSSMQFQAELLSGESLLWTGQPLRRVIFHQRDLFSIPFSLMWGGFAIFWEWGVTGDFGHSANAHAAPSFFALWGIPFVVMGQYLIWGRFLYIAWKKGRTYYAVTNKRVVVLNAGMSRKISDAFLRNLDSVSLSTRSDGTGTIEFSPQPNAQSFGFFKSNRSGAQMDIDLSQLAFHDIDDARNVYQLIQAQREQASLGDRFERA